MNNEIQTFTSNEFGELEVLDIDGKMYFPATKCAKKLGHTNPERAVREFCKGVTETVTPSEGGMQKIRIIPEGDLFRLIVKSKLESAQRFESWVFDEVLPSIRKHGAYIMPELLEEIQHNTERNAKLIAELAKEQKEKFVLSSKYEELKVENKCLCERIETFKKNEEKLTQTVNETKPKATYYDLIMSNTRAVPITLIAKDYGMDAVSMNRLLHSEGIQFQVGGTWALYSKYQNKGYTHNNVTELRTGRHVSHMCWTQAGRLFLYNYLKNIGILPQIEKEA